MITLETDRIYSVSESEDIINEAFKEGTCYRSKNLNYHNITKSDMLNGTGLRVVLWVSGCSLQCKNCHNPQTWDKDSGIPFDEDAKQEIFVELEKDYIDGITFSGGHQ